LAKWLGLPITLLLLGGAGHAQTELFPAPHPIEVELRRLLAEENAGELLRWAGHPALLHPALAEFYRARQFQPGWLDQAQAGPMALAFSEILRRAGDEGLCPEDYYLDAIEAFLAVPAWTPETDAVRPSWLARLDLLLSNAFLHYVQDLAEGRIDSNVLLDGWTSHPRRTDPARLLAYVLESGTLKTVLMDLLPHHPGYFALRQTLQDYRHLWVAGGWPEFPAGPTLHPGSEDSRVPLLRERLLASQDLPQPPVQGNQYDDATVAAVKNFQLRHGLHPDGVIGAKTRAGLNVPITDRIRQVELNLERWRWLPKTLGERYILVNIADFSLAVVQNGATVMRMPVVVGTPYRKTPVFSGRMSYLEFSPYWYVPPTILKEDLLPKFKADPTMIDQRNFEIVRQGTDELVDPATIDWPRVNARNFPGILRQKPGPLNPLGRVKFMFPNAYAVYLHDTPDRTLFSRDQRSFSSGCIRIQRPFDLAGYLLYGEAVPGARKGLADTLPASPLRVNLPAPLPVHILYWTAWIDEQGQVQFRNDIYWRDLDLEIALRPAADNNEVVAARSNRGPARGGI
jgi:murein L,D-transpeptidase YcbB/YkuD